MSETIERLLMMDDNSERSLLGSSWGSLGGSRRGSLRLASPQTRMNRMKDLIEKLMEESEAEAAHNSIDKGNSSSAVNRRSKTMQELEESFSSSSTDFTFSSSSSPNPLLPPPTTVTRMPLWVAATSASSPSCSNKTHTSRNRRKPKTANSCGRQHRRTKATGTSTIDVDEYEAAVTRRRAQQQLLVVGGQEVEPNPPTGGYVGRSACHHHGQYCNAMRLNKPMMEVEC